MRAGRSYMLQSADTPTGPWGALPGDVFTPGQGLEKEVKRIPVGPAEHPAKLLSAASSAFGRLTIWGYPAWPRAPGRCVV